MNFKIKCRYGNPTKITPELAYHTWIELNSIVLKPGLSTALGEACLLPNTWLLILLAPCVLSSSDQTFKVSMKTVIAAKYDCTTY